MGISVLGPLVVDDDTPLAPRDRTVLAALAALRGRTVTREALAEALWGEELPASWNKVVQGCVVRLRRTVGVDVIETTAGGYRLCLPPDAVDACRFEELLVRGRELAAIGQPERAAHVLGQCLALWRGAALPELDGWPTGSVEGDRLDELRLDAEEAFLAASLAAGRHREILAEAQARVSAAPLREHRWALLAKAQYQCGRQGDALRTVGRARAVLLEELGVDPGQELVDLELALLHHDPSLAVLDSGDAATTCPYLGLVPYDVGDAESYFGREAETAACLRRLADVGCLTVVGPSGNGKSSLVRAGIAAALRRTGHHVEVITPGPHPAERLDALTIATPPPVLVVDQCEEAVTLCTDVDEQARFFSSLAAWAEVAPLVVAVRADHLAGVTREPAFARLVERSLHLLGPMSTEDLRAAIEGPARQAGILLEPGLVDLLLREVDGEPGALPLLSHALEGTWQRREGRTLTVGGYQETGGIREAVGRSAEAVYEEVAADHRPVLRDLLLRLVTPTPEGEPVRSRVPTALLGDDPVRRELVEVLVDARLLTSDDATIELAHESLVRAWPRLRDWLDEDVEGQRILRHLTDAATSWEAMARPDAELYRGARLAAARDWRDRTHPSLAPVEAAFLQASSDHELAELEAAHAQLHRERRTVRRLRGLVGAVAVLALLATVASVVAVHQERRADERATVAEARRIGAEALVEPSYDRALLLAAESVRLWESSETQGNLATTIERSPGALSVFRPDGGRLRGLALSADEGRAAVSDTTDDVTLYDLRTRRPVIDIGGEDGSSYGVPVFSPDGRHLAVSMFSTSCWLNDCREHVVELRDARDGSVVGRYEHLGLPAVSIAFSSDGTLLAAAQPFALGTSENIAIWRVGEPGVPIARMSLDERGLDFRPTPSSAPPGWVAFSPDASVLYAGGAGRTAAFDVVSGAVIQTFPGMGALDISDDGRMLAIRTTLTQVGVFDTASGRQIAELVGHGAAVTAAAFAADGGHVATASNDGTAALWSVESGQRQQLLEGHAGSVVDLTFGRGDDVLHTVGEDGSWMTWDLKRDHGLVREVSPARLPDLLRGVLVGPRGTSALFLDHGGRLRLLGVGRRSMTETVVPPDSVRWAAYLPDGSAVATVGSRGEVALFDASSGERLVRREGRGVPNGGAIAVMPQGRTLVVADEDGLVTELDASTLQPTGRTIRTGIQPHGIRTTAHGVVAVTSSKHTSERTSEIVFADLDDGRVLHRMNYRTSASRTAFNRDGSRYALGAADGRLTIIDPRSGAVVSSSEPVHEGGVSWVTFAPDGRTIASVGFAGELVLTDAETGAVRTRMQARKANVAEAGMEFRDDHTVVVAYSDGSMYSYDIHPANWVRHACAVAGRDLTPEEWRAAFGDQRWRPTCGPSSETGTG